MNKASKEHRTMKSVTDQYRDASVTITTGHEADLSRVRTPLYSEEENETWSLMVERQMKALPNRAVPEFLEGLATLQLPYDRIPKLRDISKRLEEATGWRITRVEGLVPEREFFECLSQKLFPCTDFIREREEIDYTPSPDMFHDVFGHLPLITNPVFASFYEFYGKMALNTSGDALTRLQRIYWFSVEFGLIRSADGRRIYGSGILSSPEEVHYSLGDKVRVHPWDFDAVANQYFEIHHMQDDLFEIESFQVLLDGFRNYAKREGLF